MFAEGHSRLSGFSPGCDNENETSDREPRNNAAQGGIQARHDAVIEVHERVLPRKRTAEGLQPSIRVLLRSPRTTGAPYPPDGASRREPPRVARALGRRRLNPLGDESGLRVALLSWIAAVRLVGSVGGDLSGVGVEHGESGP